MQKKILWACALLIVLAVCAVYLKQVKVKPCQDCNVILISIDTLRSDHLSSYGYSLKTPAIDSLADDSVLFKTAIAQAPSTAPSHASIFTSLIPAGHGAFLTRQSSIREEIPTLPEFMKNNGFRTASFNGGGQLDKRFGFGRGFDIYDSFSGQDYENEKFSEKVSKGLEWINKEPDKKFFLFLHSYDIHVPYAPEKSDFEAILPAYKGKLTLPITDRFLRGVNNKKIKLSDSDKEFIKAAYDADLRSVDRSIHTLLEELKRRHLYDNTLIVFTSDHGEEFGEHGFMAWHSHSLFDELLKVPLIIKFPYQAMAGKKIDLQVRSIDILPTILESAGIKAIESFQGKSLIDAASGKISDYSIYAISQKDRGKNLPTSNRTKEWKLYKNNLYDLVQDPGETKDIAENKPAIKEELRKIIEENKKLDVPSDKSKIKIDGESVEQLKTLGYF